MHRFFLPPEECRESTLQLPRAEAHHAVSVLRIRVGQDVTVLNGAGTEFRCSVARVEKHQVELSVREIINVPPLPWQLTLVQALPKHKAMDFIVQKAIELGAHRIVPVASERCVSQVEDAADAGRKAEHWQATAIESVKQCGSPWLPRIEPAVSLADYLRKQEPFDLSLIAAWQSDSLPVREQVEVFQKQHKVPPKSVRVWIGPEGDFTPDEVAAIRKGGSLPITLGRNVLRCDTAAIYCLSVLNHELQYRWA